MKTVHWTISGVAAAAVLASGVALAGSLGGSPNAAAGEGQAVVTELGGNAKAVTYWTDHPEGARVVTTVDTVTAAETDAEQHAVVRLQSVLQPGQVQEVSVPFAAGEAQPVLRIERIGDQIRVSKVTQ
jgi:hypothetical protein